jgi:hypothetical protein
MNSQLSEKQLREFTLPRKESFTRYRFIIAYISFIVVLLIVWFVFKRKLSLNDLLNKSGILPDNGTKIPSLQRITTFTPRRKNGDGILVNTTAGDPRLNTHPWNKFLTDVTDQANCSSCWAFATADMLRDRYGVFSGDIIPQLSAQSLLDAANSPLNRISGCEKLDKCQCGEIPAYALELARLFGIRTSDCMPYRAKNANVLPGNSHSLCETSPNCFYEGSNINTSCVKYNFKSIFSIATERDASKELANNGTLMAVIGISKWFSQNVYKSGVLDPPPNQKYEGWHAVCLVGETSDAWVIRNSWGTSVHTKGFFKLKKYVNALNIGQFGFFGGYF